MTVMLRLGPLRWSGRLCVDRTHTKYDLIGPPDTSSNISPLKYRKTENAAVSSMLGRALIEIV